MTKPASFGHPATARAQREQYRGSWRNMQNVRPPLSGWLGGKSRLTKTIIPLIPPHTCYAEPFAGAGWVLFRKEPSKAEVLNDISGEVVNLYRVIRFHLEEFIRYFKWLLVSREEFQRQLRANPSILTDIQRAVRFYYLQKLSFGGKVGKSPTYGTATTNPPRLNLLRIEEDLSQAHLRLCQVNIENLPYGDLIPRYDRTGTFFYIDPPYWGCEDDYGKGLFSSDDFTMLSDLLGGIQGKFLMSINDAPEIREVFGGFGISEVQTGYSVGKSRNRVTELLIRNY